MLPAVHFYILFYIIIFMYSLFYLLNQHAVKLGSTMLYYIILYLLNIVFVHQFTFNLILICYINM